MTRCKPLPEVINGFKVIAYTDRFKGRRRIILAECKLCKNHYETCKAYLIVGNSCGCSWKTNGVPRRLQHSYAQMKERCYGHSNIRNMIIYKDINVCAEWLNSSKSFYKWALENGYSEKLTLDRIDNNKGYYPDNCRWATLSQQQRNRKMSRFKEDDVKYIRNNPENLSQKELAEKFKCSPGAISRIVNRHRFKDI